MLRALLLLCVAATVAAATTAEVRSASAAAAAVAAAAGAAASRDLSASTSTSTSASVRSRAAVAARDVTAGSVASNSASAAAVTFAAPPAARPSVTATLRARRQRGTGTGSSGSGVRRSARSSFDRVWLPPTAMSAANPNGDPTFCVATETYCQNGGYINTQMGDCLSWVICNLDPPYQYWYDTHTCTCPPQFAGIDCSIVLPPNATATVNATAGNSTSVCPTGQVWDGTFLNINATNKHVECFLDNTDAQRAWSLRQHRVNVTIDASRGSGNSTIMFVLTSRHRNNSDQPSDPTYMRCGPVVHDITCNLELCTYQMVAGVVTYSCNSVKCKGCDPALGCSLILNAVIQNLSPPVTLTFNGIDPNAGTSSLVFATNLMQLDLGCQTGSCAGNLEADDQPAPSTRLLVIALASGGGAFALLVGACVYAANRKPATGKWVQPTLVSGTGAAANALQIEGDSKEGLSSAITVTSAGTPRFALVYDSVTCEIQTSAKAATTRMVLKGITGVVHPGEMVAILGPSGAGKSTLLDILADRRKDGVKGFVGLDNPSIRCERRKDVLHYVLQDDLLMPTQTVREALSFSASLRLPAGTSAEAIALRVQRVLGDLSLLHIADSRIGTSDSGGISGGERKRVSIGMELVTEPGMMLLDEPTSGLDSANAELVVKLMKDTAARSCACVMTIHQPPARVFALFDKILLLSRRGELVYFGPTARALQYFTEGLGVAAPDAHVNLAEWLVDVMASASAEQLSAMAQRFRTSELGAALHAEVAATRRRMEEQKPGPAQQRYTREAPGFFRRFGELSARTFRNVSRDPSLMLSQTVVTVCVALALGGVFWQVNDAIDGTQNRLGAIFFMCIFFSLMSMSCLGNLVTERTLYLRERDAGYYTPLPYLLSQVCCDLLPMRVLPPLLFGGISYFMIGLNGDPYRVVFCLFGLVLVNLVATASCFAISAAVNSAAQANLVASLYFIFCFLFGGLFYNSQTSGSDATYLTYASFVHYAYEALCSNEFVGLSLLFNPKGYSSVIIPGTTILSNYAMDPDMKWWDMWILCLIALFKLIVTYVLLRMASSPVASADPMRKLKLLMTGALNGTADTPVARQSSQSKLLSPTEPPTTTGFGKLVSPTNGIGNGNSNDHGNGNGYGNGNGHANGHAKGNGSSIDANGSAVVAPTPLTLHDAANGNGNGNGTGNGNGKLTPSPRTPVETKHDDQFDSGRHRLVKIAPSPSPPPPQLQPQPKSLPGVDTPGAGLQPNAAMTMPHALPVPLPSPLPVSTADDALANAADPLIGVAPPAFALVYDDVRCSIQTAAKSADAKCGGWCAAKPPKRQVLNGISGIIHPGEMVAILGPSGAGKSTFLDILADRRRDGVEGFIALDHESRRCRKRKSVIHYVLQDDLLMPTQTVREALVFSATLRLPPGTSRDAINAKVQRVLEDLSLVHIAESRIGTSDSGGISGGERKRVSIGMELVTEPGMMLLDEPTSGLDSANAELVVRVLKETAARQCACVMTIHQPPASVFALFDKILLLNRFGELVYFGPTAQALPHFTHTVGLPEPAQFVNLAEWLVDVMATATPDELKSMAVKYAQSEPCRKLHDDIRIARNRHADKQALKANTSAYRRETAHFGTRFGQLSLRALRNIARNPSLMLTQSVVTICVALALGGVFWQVNNLIDGTQNRLGVLFFACIFFSLMSMSSLSLLVEERVLYLRERDAGYYSPLPYFLSQLTCDVLPMRVLPPIAFGAISYYMMGLNDAPGRMPLCLVALVLTNLSATTACFAISAAVNTVAQANLAASLYFVFGLLFGGLFFNAETTGSNAVYLTYASFVHYAYEALCANEFIGLNLLFNPKGYDVTPITGETILSNYALDKDMRFYDLWILVAWSCAALTLTYLLLRYRRGIYQK